VQQHLPLADGIARSFCRRYGDLVELDDLRQEARAPGAGARRRSLPRRSRGALLAASYCSSLGIKNLFDTPY
jgi:hypothetical protein